MMIACELQPGLAVRLLLAASPAEPAACMKSYNHRASSYLQKSREFLKTMNNKMLMPSAFSPTN